MKVYPYWKGRQMPRRRTTPVAYSWEAVLAERIAEERKARGWSYADMASAMTDAGCPLNQSAIYKIESPRQRRQISLDEAQVFARVLGKSLEELLSRPEDEAVREAVDVFIEAAREVTHLRGLADVLRHRQQELDKKVARFRELATREGVAPGVVAALAGADVDGDPIQLIDATIRDTLTIEGHVHHV